MTAGDLLQWLSMAQKSGTLTIAAQSVEKRVFFRNGRIISSASTDPREYLGQFLMSYGYITEEELKKAMEVQRQSKILLGKILVMINAIKEEDLLRLMRLKAEEEIYDIFLWPDADFVFAVGELPQVELVPLHVDVTGIVMEGHRRLDEWKRIREVLPHRGKVPVIDTAVKLEEFSEPRQRIIQAINGTRNIEEIILESRSSEFNVSSTVLELVLSGSARVIDPPKPDVAPFDLSAAPAAAEVDDEDEVSALLARAQKSLKAGDFEKGLRIMKAAQNLDPNNAKVKNAFKGAETIISSELKRGGIVESKVPKLVRPIEELSNLNFSPNEGFILSRINGMWDISSIMKISPMRETDALLIFHKLMKEKIITLS
jgi:hypothetical protein